jgi:hypothetical protein
MKIDGRGVAPREPRFSAMRPFETFVDSGPGELINED